MNHVIQSIAFYKTDCLVHTRSFYEGLLGLKLIKDQGLCHIYQVTPTSAIGFCTHHPKSKTSDACVTFVFEQRLHVDTWHQTLEKKGLNPTQPSVNERFQIYHFFVRDPNDYMVEFQVFLSQSHD